MSQSSWLVAGIVPGVERQPLKKLAIKERALLNLLRRWPAEAEKKGHRITRITVAFEAGHDGFWLARWLAAQGVEAHVIHASSVAVTREHRRAKTDWLDTELLKRAFLGWLRGERGHCKMVAADVMTPGDLRHAATWLKALSHEAALRLRVPPPTTASPRDHLDAAQRVAAILMDSHTPVLIAILTTIGSHRSLAQNAPAKPIIRDQPRKWQVVPP